MIRKIKKAKGGLLLLIAILSVQVALHTCTRVTKLVAIITGEVDNGYTNDQYGKGFGNNMAGYYPQPYGGYQKAPIKNNNYGSNKWSINGTVTIELENGKSKLSVDISFKSSNGYPSYERNEIERSLRIHKLGVLRQYSNSNNGGYGSYGGYSSHGSFSYGDSINDVCASAGDISRNYKSFKDINEVDYRILEKCIDVKMNDGIDIIDLTPMKGLAVVLYEKGSANGDRIACGTLAVAETTPEPLFSCGVPFFEQSEGSLRIIGGSEANPHSWPWAAVMTSSLGSCGGTLISPDWIITAAHCLSNSDILNPGNVQIRLGEHDRFKDEGTEQIIRANRIIIEPSYNGQVTSIGDIALIRLERPADINKYVIPICLPETSEIIATVGLTAYTVGWGRTASNLPASNILNQVAIEIVDNNSIVCNAVASEQICAGDDNLLQGICNGDSGSSLQLKIDGKYVLVGISSFGLTSCTSYGGYTRVTSFREWIRVQAGV